ncbi:hypothetical protein E2C01_038173 [Portunus trituberculatus]|uniref:Uncharacterized protein n=1 Tax=Portunus trituberculatus TaxID=210409 RepID=A0A5B7FA59_PORTR|nr:hypothetical protein [Portunus trituberculatus]
MGVNFSSQKDIHSSMKYWWPHSGNIVYVYTLTASMLYGAVRRSLSHQAASKSVTSGRYEVKYAAPSTCCACVLHFT